jgi:hypothetical protein
MISKAFFLKVQLPPKAFGFVADLPRGLFEAGGKFEHLSKKNTASENEVKLEQNRFIYLSVRNPRFTQQVRV